MLRCLASKPNPKALNLTMCAVMSFFFFLSLSFSFIRPKPSRLFLHPSLLLPTQKSKGCVLQSFPLGPSLLSQQSNQLLYHSRCPSAETQKAPPGCHLCPLFNWHLLLGRLVFSPFYFFLTFFLLTNCVLSMSVRKKKRLHYLTLN